MSVRHALLAMLAEGPKIGLRLREEFEERTGDVWPLNVGQVYTTLGRLERDGLVEARSTDEDGPQKGYRITAAGRSEVDAWLHTAPAAIPPRDELVIKVLVAVGVPGVDMPAMLQSHRRALVELMQTYTSLKQDAAGDVRVALVVDAELYRLDALIRWLDSADARLRSIGAAPSVVADTAPSAVARRGSAVVR
jgi:DNA-binding PadR family transcriptional regulator